MPKPTGISPGQRYRIEQWAPHLASDHGIEVEYDVFESPELTRVLYEPGHLVEKAGRMAFDTGRRAAAVMRARTYDAVLVYREVATLGPALYERLLRWSGVPFILDFDDAIWLPGAGSRQPLLSKLRFPGKTSSACRAAAAVTVGNRYLAEYALRRNSRVEIVPTTIDLDRYAAMDEPATDEPFVIAWTGSFSTLIHLEMARDAIERLAQRREVVLRVICSEPPARPFAVARNEFVPWRAETEAADVGACHVGIMPLPDDAFARGKCGCKALQFMATGRPVVVAPVGINAEIIADDENGLLATTTDEWVAQLDRLAGSAELRQRLGAAGRRTVEEKYSARAAAAVFARVVRDVRRTSALRS